MFALAIFCAGAAAAAPDRVSREDLRAELLRLMQEDQAVRLEMVKLPRPISLERLEELREGDRRRTARLKQIVDEVGWPGRPLVGVDGAKAAWLLAQHADQDAEFQRRVLAMIEPLVANGEVAREQYAYLYDRTHAPQRYGTQGRCNADHRFEPREIEDPANVDGRRKAMDLPPLQEYLDFATKRLCVK